MTRKLLFASVLILPLVAHRQADAVPFRALSASLSLRAVAVSGSRISLQWAANQLDGGTYAVERSSKANSGFVQIAVTAGNVTSYVDTGLSPSTTRYYRVRSQAKRGPVTGYSNVASATTFALNATATTTPSETPSPIPTDTPTSVPSPTSTPSDTPTPIPSSTPTRIPTFTSVPTSTPTNSVTPIPTASQTPSPSYTVTLAPTRTATATVTMTPTIVPTDTPKPTSSPTATPSFTAIPTATAAPNCVTSTFPSMIEYWVLSTKDSYPPGQPAACNTAKISAGQFDTCRNLVYGGEYQSCNGLMKFATGDTIPAGATVLTATLRFWNVGFPGNLEYSLHDNVPMKHVLGEYFNWGSPCDPSDFTTTSAGGAFSVPLQDWLPDADTERVVNLSNLSNIASGVGGVTYLRTHIDGDAVTPTGLNEMSIYGDGNPYGYPVPQLAVQWCQPAQP